MNKFNYYIKIFGLAITTLGKNLKRTLLTLLGIIVSIVAIILTMSAGTSVEKYINKQMKAFGTNTIQVEISTPNTNHISAENMKNFENGAERTTLTADDAKAINKLPNITNSSVALLGQKRLIYKGKAHQITFFGTDSNIIFIDTSLNINTGRFISNSEVKTYAHSIVVGSEIAKDIFGHKNPIGETLKISGQTYRVVGLLKDHGSSFGVSYDKFIYVPYTTMQKEILGVNYIQSITVAVNESKNIYIASKNIESLLRLRHGIDEPKYDDFAVTTIKEAQEMIEVIFNMLNILLLALSSISIIVGGVGIMNVMLISVEERQKEIGLRKSLGARKNDIMWQFLSESIVIALLSAIIGIILSILLLSLASYTAFKYGYDVEISLSNNSIFIALGFSLSAGIIFGVYPAKKASEIEPISAMRK